MALTVCKESTILSTISCDPHNHPMSSVSLFLPFYMSSCSCVVCHGQHLYFTNGETGPEIRYVTRGSQ